MHHPYSAQIQSILEISLLFWLQNAIFVTQRTLFYVQEYYTIQHQYQKSMSTIFYQQAAQPLNETSFRQRFNQLELIRRSLRQAQHVRAWLSSPTPTNVQAAKERMILKLNIYRKFKSKFQRRQNQEQAWWKLISLQQKCFSSLQSKWYWTTKHVTVVQNDYEQ